MNISKRGTIILFSFLIAITPFFLGLPRQFEDWFITIAAVIVLVTAYRLEVNHHDASLDERKKDTREEGPTTSASNASLGNVVKEEKGAGTKTIGREISSRP